MKIDRKRLLDALREHLFGGHLTQAQVDGLNVLLDVWERHYADHDIRWLAYALATAWHETGGRMQPVRETFAETDEEALRHLRRWRRNIAYARVWPDTGKAYFGRGFVQLTWRDNYARAGRALGLDLVHKPELALEPRIAAHILFRGMIEGWFTGKKLADYIRPGRQACYVAARRVVNGLDRARRIARHAIAFEKALRAALVPEPLAKAPPTRRPYERPGLAAALAAFFVAAANLAVAAWQYALQPALLAAIGVALLTAIGWLFWKLMHEGKMADV